MDTNVLAAEEVLSVLERRRQGELHDSVLPGSPALVGGGVADWAGLPAVIVRLRGTETDRLGPPNLHLEPVSRAVVAANGAGCLGHVEEARTGVLDELVVEDLEADAVPGLDIVRASAVVGNGALVAAQVVAKNAYQYPNGQ